MHVFEHKIGSIDPKPNQGAKKSRHQQVYRQSHACHAVLSPLSKPVKLTGLSAPGSLRTLTPAQMLHFC